MARLSGPQSQGSWSLWWQLWRCSLHDAANPRSKSGASSQVPELKTPRVWFRPPHSARRRWASSVEATKRRSPRETETCATHVAAETWQEKEIYETDPHSPTANHHGRRRSRRAFCRNEESSRPAISRNTAAASKFNTFPGRKDECSRTQSSEETKSDLRPPNGRRSGSRSVPDPERIARIFSSENRI